MPGHCCSVASSRGVESRLRDAERWLHLTADLSEGSEAPTTEMVVAAEEEFRRLPSWIAIYRAAQAQAQSDVATTVTCARRALELVLEDDHLARGAAAGFLGLAAWTSGDLESGPHGRMPNAWRACGRQGICPTPSVLRSHRRTYGLRRVDSARQCAPMRRHWNLRRRKSLL